MLSEALWEYPNVFMNLFQAANASASPFEECCSKLVLSSFEHSMFFEELDEEAQEYATATQQAQDKKTKIGIVFM